MSNSRLVLRLLAPTGLCALALCSLSEFSCAETITTLYGFAASPSDGAEPFGKLVFGPGKVLYGTTTKGGTFDQGTIFALAPNGTETILYSFAGGADGALPYAGLIFDNMHNAYGTTSAGGAFGLGTAFKVTPTGDEAILHSFGAKGDGSVPYGALVLDKSGNLYGTTSAGGRNGGTIFKITPDGSETVLRALTTPDGVYPQDRLVVDGRGNLYGTAEQAGPGDAGTVFKLAPSGTFTILHAFQRGIGGDGGEPVGGLTVDAAGNLYGTTLHFGSIGNNGIVYKLAPDGSETILHTFGLFRADGVAPTCDLVLDAAGTLYGTTQRGGVGMAGTVFMVASDGTETVIHKFDDSDGYQPYAGLISDNLGNFYGTTTSYGPNHRGTVFKITR